ncbi:alpha/beta hydrolase [Subtercola sp. YIM 133946]|uniref:alpha/beta hydrolase n=1 Tax=Subtercola sp. YIM 133946 TaxID=3118909 RepID=UPI002F94D979
MDARLDPRLTDLDAARFTAHLNNLNRGLPVGRDAGVDATRKRLRIARDADTADVTSNDIQIACGGRGLRLRVYSPATNPGGSILFFHGGGWMMGDLDTNDTLCRELCMQAGASVVNVDYRLAPEHPYPAAIHDGVAALRWLASGADGLVRGADRIAVAGHSSGGNIAAVLAQLAAAGEAPRVVHQLLLCAVLDSDTTRDSYRENATGLLMTTAEMEWYWELYCPDPHRRTEPAASPLNRANLSGLAPATIVVAEHDTLRDEGLEYAGRLRAAGVPTHTIFIPGVPHLFITFPPMPSRDRAIAQSAGRLKEALASPDGS